MDFTHIYNRKKLKKVFQIVQIVLYSYLHLKWMEILYAILIEPQFTLNWLKGHYIPFRRGMLSDFQHASHLCTFMRKS